MRVRVTAVLLLFDWGICLFAAAQENQEIQEKPGQTQGAAPVQPILTEVKAAYIQELDSDSAALSKIPPDPLVQPDPLFFVLRPIDDSAIRFSPSKRMVFGATYTLGSRTITRIKCKRLGACGKRLPSASWGRRDVS